MSEWYYISYYRLLLKSIDLQDRTVVNPINQSDWTHTWGSSLTLLVFTNVVLVAYGKRDTSWWNSAEFRGHNPLPAIKWKNRLDSYTHPSIHSVIHSFPGNGMLEWSTWLWILCIAYIVRMNTAAEATASRYLLHLVSSRHFGHLVGCFMIVSSCSFSVRTLKNRRGNVFHCPTWRGCHNGRSISRLIDDSVLVNRLSTTSSRIRTRPQTSTISLTNSKSRCDFNELNE